MEKKYTNKTLYRRLFCSISALLIGLPCFFSGVINDNQNFPLMRFLQVLRLHEHITENEIFTFTLGIMAFSASLIFLMMIIGWILNLPSDRSWKAVIIVGCIFCIPNTLIYLSTGNFFKRTDLLIIPLALLVFYLTYWYFSDKNQHSDHQ